VNLYSEHIDLINLACGLSAAVLCRLEEVQCALALTILTMGIALAAGHARAQTYDRFSRLLYVVPWEAALTIMQLPYDGQCRASAAGQMCSLNPYYAGATAPVRRTIGVIFAKSDQDRHAC
jgi:hypothetical protein